MSDKLMNILLAMWVTVTLVVIILYTLKDVGIL